MLVVNRFVNIKHEQYGQDFERIGLADPSSCENVTIVIRYIKKARHIGAGEPGAYKAFGGNHQRRIYL